MVSSLQQWRGPGDTFGCFGCPLLGGNSRKYGCCPPAPADVLMQETWNFSQPRQRRQLPNLLHRSQTSGPASRQRFCLLPICHGALFPWAPSKFPHLFFQHLSALGVLEGIAQTMRGTSVGVQVQGGEREGLRRKVSLCARLSARCHLPLPWSPQPLGRVPGSGSRLPSPCLWQSGHPEPRSRSLRRRAMGRGALLGSGGMLRRVPGLCARPGHPQHRAAQQPPRWLAACWPGHWFQRIIYSFGAANWSSFPTLPPFNLPPPSALQGQ